ncbi:MAG TPA: alpha/beta hydrolase, partial [Actinomycetes bacterium]|nr:alpha/beta hydrolase [Actinomycetes bacterium]
MALLPEIRALLDQQAASGRPPLQRQSVAQARAFHDQDASALNGPAAPVASVQDRVVPGPAGELPVRVYTPRGAPPWNQTTIGNGGA